MSTTTRWSKCANAPGKGRWEETESFLMGMKIVPPEYNGAAFERAGR